MHTVNGEDQKLQISWKYYPTWHPTWHRLINMMLAHPCRQLTSLLGDLYCCAKFDCNQCSSFHNIKVWIFTRLVCKCLFTQSRHAPKYGFWGECDVTPKIRSNRPINKTPKGTVVYPWVSLLIWLHFISTEYSLWLVTVTTNWSLHSARPSSAWSQPITAHCVQIKLDTLAFMYSDRRTYNGSTFDNCMTLIFDPYLRVNACHSC